MKKESTTGIILAGGKSSRMGQDKGLMNLKGEMFVQHIIKALAPIVTDIIIVSENSDYDAFKLKRVSDILKDLGPLAGLYTGLYHSETENNIVLSCDVPMIQTVVLNRLIEARDTKHDVVQIESEGNKMPLIALYQKKCMHHVLKRLKDGEKRLQVVVNEMKIKTLVLETPLQSYVRNINTKSDLLKIRNECNH